MYQYINPQGEYPRYYGDIILENPYWKIGDELPAGWASVEESDLPLVAENELIFEASPMYINGKFFRNWQVRPLTLEQIQARKEQDAEAIAEEEAATLVI